MYYIILCRWFGDRIYNVANILRRYKPFAYDVVRLQIEYLAQ